MANTTAPETSALTSTELDLALTSLDALLNTPAISAAMWPEQRVQIRTLRQQLMVERGDRPLLPQRVPAPVPPEFKRTDRTVNINAHVS